METQISDSSSGRKNGRVGWIMAVLLILFALWVIYTSIQTQVVESRTTSTEISATQMPANMPGMNH